MDSYSNTCPLSQRQLLDEFFMEHRTKILDLAAYLDRFDRSVDQNAGDDFRLRALREALTVLTADGPQRVKRAQLLLSDQDSRLLEERDQQSAWGAPAHLRQDGQR